MDLSSTIIDRFKFEFSSQILAVFSGAILTVVLTRLLTPDEYGLLYLSLSVFAVVVLFTKLGIARSASRYVSELKEKKPGQVPNILQFAFLFNLVLIALFCTLFFILHKEIALIIGEPELVPLLFIGGLYICFRTLFYFSRLIFQGLENVQYASIATATKDICRLVFIGSFVLIGMGAVGALLGYILAYIVASVVSLYIIFTKHYRSYKKEPVENGLKRRILEYSLPIAVTQTASTIDRHIDTILLGFFTGPVAVAYYALGKQIIGFVQTPASALGFSLSPSYGAEKAKNNTKSVANIYTQSLSYLLAIYIPAATGLILVAEPVVKYIFGSNYLGAVTVIQILALYTVVGAISDITSNGLDFLGRAKQRAVARILSAVLNVILNILLIPLYGAVGAALATLITYSLYVLINIYIMYAEVAFDILSVLIVSLKTLLASAVMAITVYSLLGLISGIISLLVVCAIGGAIWMVLALWLKIVHYDQLTAIFE